ncbi:MAG: exodeoxyribonuclease VII small subunit [Gemmatimonadaceae bacterium]
MTAPVPNESPATYEASLSRLEAIVRELERDDVELDRALALFEEGIARLRLASAALERADAQVRILTEHADGRLRVSDLDG